MLITDTIRRQLAAGGVDVRPVGMRSLKGLTESVELFAVDIAPRGAQRALDPVCGMEIASDAAEASLTWRGREFVFCSDDCVRRFMRQLDRYTSAVTP